MQRAMNVKYLYSVIYLEISKLNVVHKGNDNSNLACSGMLREDSLK